MCGIAGTFAYHQDAPPAELAEVQRMTDAMAARGPDGQGHWTSRDGCIVLGHRRLAILDLSEAGAQPMHSADGRLSIVFNGEIYNYRELRREMESHGYQFCSTSDTEVLLALWDRLGSGMLPKLRGMFAIALWDSQKRSLFLARDPFGIKPLYYADDGNALRFASQVKSILASGAVSTKLDAEGLAGFYGLGFIPDPSTAYQSIRSIPAGHWVQIGTNGFNQPKPYFSINEVLACAEETAFHNPQSVEDLRHSAPELLLDSVRHHLVSDVPVGLFLSSGLDSSTLLSLARESGATNVETVTLGFREYRGLSQDETPLASYVANHFDANHHIQWLDREGFSQCLDDALRAMDQPSVDGLNTYFVAKAAADAGMKVALSGLGGDELFGGYPSFHQVPRLSRLLKPSGLIPSIGPLFRRAFSPFTGRRISPKWASTFEYGASFEGAYFLRRALFLPWEFPGLNAEVDLEEGWKSLNLIERLRDSMSGLRTDRARMIALEATWYMRSQLLRDTDWAAMAHSLEVRAPFVDSSLFCKLAPLLVNSRPIHRRDLAAALHSPPPAEVLRRPKTGFNMPIRDWVEDLRKCRETTRGIRGWGRFIGQALPENATLAALQNEPGSARRILIFRIGSLGDTVVALPSFHLISRAFPNANRRVLTNFPESRKAPPLSSILGVGDLVHGYLEFPPRASLIKKLRHTRRQLREFRPEVVIYLMPVRTRWQIIRDRLFFKLCGVHRMVGLPETEIQRTGAMNLETGLWTHESERLLSTLSRLGHIDSGEATAWEFHFTPEEKQKAHSAVQALPSNKPILALSLGTKNPVNEWGHENWTELLIQLSEELPDWSLLLVGAQEDHAPSQSLAERWPNASQNLCGALSPREGAISLQKAALFMGHDSGPLHLAAAVGVPCVAVYSARNPPGEWFPYGKNHEVVHHQVSCSGCRLTECLKQNKRCINGIQVMEVKAAVNRILAKLNGESRCRH